MRHTTEAPNTFGEYPIPEESHRFQALGYEIDSLGRPVHPWAATLLLENPDLPEGKGAYWHWGPNQTGDPVIMTREASPRILLIERADPDNNGASILALPGGFVDEGETGEMTAVRETEEETGFVITTPGQRIYKGPVADPRTTLNAWPETDAYLFRVSTASPVQADPHDTAVRSAGWYDISTLPEKLYGSHRELIDAAIQQLNSPRPAREVLAIPESERSVTLITAGHMAYKHYLTTYKHTTLFVKEHDETQFSDAFREKHSRAYLEKEAIHYKHLQEQGFKAIPADVTLVDDTLLGMEYLGAEDGWYWKAPKQHINAYTKDLLEAFDELQTLPHLHDHPFHETIAPTYDTFWSEGWDAIDSAVHEAIYEKITKLTIKWDIARQKNALSLLEALPELQRSAVSLNRYPELFFAHNDARQSNIAWHPEKKAKIADWSWADLAPKNADATMLLIDLAKSGYDVTPYLDHFNADFALQLIGFWLAHSTWKTRDGSTTVREHQIASASSAFQLLQSFIQ